MRSTPEKLQKCNNSVYLGKKSSVLTLRQTTFASSDENHYDQFKFASQNAQVIIPVDVLKLHYQVSISELDSAIVVLSAMFFSPGSDTCNDLHFRIEYSVYVIYNMWY